MASSSTDHAFLRFQRAGAATDLAEVFDDIAGELLRVANHLTHDLNTAEDLVQATFLTAIERRSYYKPTGSVVSWMIGILTNQARVTRRMEDRTIDPSRLPNDQVQDPVKILEERELSKSVTDAVAKLPKTYQAVVNLHLRYGMSAKRIALDLSRSPSTVRTQLGRGMKLLRLALPAGLVAGTAVLTVSAPGLAAMREAVLSKATAAAASTSSALALTKLTLWTAAGSLTAAALAVSLMAPDQGQVTFDELSPKATAQVVAQKGFVDSPATASAALQADPFSSSSRLLMTISDPAPNAPGGANTMKTNNGSLSSLSQNFGIQALLLGAFTLLSGTAGAQSVIYTIAGDKMGDIFGSSVSVAGDLNADGFADFMAGEPGFGLDPDGTPGTGDELSDLGRVYVYSGKDGTILWARNGEQAGKSMGRDNDAVGDVNNDGIPDIGVGDRLAEVDPDGTPGTGDELSNAGRAYVFSGKDGTTLWTRDGENAGDYMGWCIRGVGDVNGDTFPDVMSGLRGYDPDPDGTPGNGDELSNAGRVYVFSGKDGSTLYSIDGEAKGDSFGWSISALSDVNFDAIPDILVGAYAFDPDPDGTPSTGDELNAGGRAYALSGKDGSTLYTFDGENVAGFHGQMVEDIGDVNSDGFPDIAVSADKYDPDPDGTPGTGDELSDGGRVYVYSGFDGSTLWIRDGENAGDEFGETITDIGDLNADGAPDVVVGAPKWDADFDGPDNTAGPSGAGPDGTLFTADDFIDDIQDNGRLYVLSGKDGTTLWTIDGEQGGMSFFNCCGGIWFSQGGYLGAKGNGRPSLGSGDVNGDGIPDIVASESSWAHSLGADGTAGTGDEARSLPHGMRRNPASDRPRNRKKG